MIIARHLHEGSARIALVDGDELVNLKTDHDDLPELLASEVPVEELVSEQRMALSQSPLEIPQVPPSSSPLRWHLARESAAHLLETRCLQR